MQQDGGSEPRYGRSINRQLLARYRWRCDARYREDHCAHVGRRTSPIYLSESLRACRASALMLPKSAGPASPLACPSAHAFRRKAKRSSSVCSISRSASRTTSLADAWRPLEIFSLTNSLSSSVRETFISVAGALDFPRIGGLARFGNPLPSDCLTLCGLSARRLAIACSHACETSSSVLPKKRSLAAFLNANGVAALFRRSIISVHYRSLTRSPACRKAAAPMFCPDEVPASRTHRDLILEKAE